MCNTNNEKLLLNDLNRSLTISFLHIYCCSHLLQKDHKQKGKEKKKRISVQ